eukprot:scaffold27440_cov124-Isochrysis_galbana.AAC.4
MARMLRNTKYEKRTTAFRVRGLVRSGYGYDGARYQPSFFLWKGSINYDQRLSKSQSERIADAFIGASNCG